MISDAREFHDDVLIDVLYGLRSYIQMVLNGFEPHSDKLYFYRKEEVYLTT